MGAWVHVACAMPLSADPVGRRCRAVCRNEAQLHWDPYAVLGLNPGATKAQTRKAYRRLAKVYHPDVNAGDPEKAERFKQVQRAYEVLTGEKQPPPVRVRPRPNQPDDEHPFLRYLYAYLARQQSGDARACGHVKPENEDAGA